MIFTPKALVDRHLAVALQDVSQGRTHGPYSTANSAIEELEIRVGKRAKKPHSENRATGAFFQD